MLIYFVRHGQTPENASGTFQGPEALLSPEGEVQAGKVAERLSNLKINEIWTSPMKRAHQTAEIINEFQKVGIKEIAELSELKRPSSIVGKNYTDPAVQALKYPLGIERLNDPHFKIEDGESFADLMIRARELVEILEKKAAKVPKDHTILMTSHGLMLATILIVVMLGGQVTPALGLEALKKLKIQNTGISIAEFNGKNWRILTISDYGHL